MSRPPSLRSPGVRRRKTGANPNVRARAAARATPRPGYAPYAFMNTSTAAATDASISFGSARSATPNSTRL